MDKPPTFIKSNDENTLGFKNSKYYRFFKAESEIVKLPRCSLVQEMIIKNKSQIQQHFFLPGAFCFVFKFSRSSLCSSVILQWIIAFPLKIEHGIELPLENGSSDFLLFFMKLNSRWGRGRCFR